MEPKPPSAGKTVAIAGGIAIPATHVLFVVLNTAWGLSWADYSFCADLIALATALAGLAMHNSQRKKENEVIVNGPELGNSDSVRGPNSSGGPNTGATSAS